MVLLHPLALHGEVLLHLCPSIAGVLLHLVHAVLYTMGVFVSISANGGGRVDSVHENKQGCPEAAQDFVQ